jgi:hypothetical protein
MSSTRSLPADDVVIRHCKIVSDLIHTLRVIRHTQRLHDAATLGIQTLWGDPRGRIGEHMISRTQVRAARAILGWSVRDLAMRSFFGIAAVNLIEGADVLPSENSRQLAAVRATLEAAGIELLEGNATARRTLPFPH